MSHSLNLLQNEKGETISPILPEDVKNYLIAIDGSPLVQKNIEILQKPG